MFGGAAPRVLWLEVSQWSFDADNEEGKNEEEEEEEEEGEIEDSGEGSQGEQEDASSESPGQAQVQIVISAPISPLVTLHYVQCCNRNSCAIQSHVFSGKPCYTANACFSNCELQDWS